MEAKVAKTLMEAYASVYDQPEQINELKVAPDYDGPPIKGPGVGDLPPKKKPEKPSYKGPRVKDGPGGRKPIRVGLPIRKIKNMMNREDVDVFDIVKGYLMTEHDLTEEQAMKVMLELEDEHRDAILEAYVVTLADKRGNTKAYQNYLKGMKNQKTGEPLYKAAPHLKGV